MLLGNLIAHGFDQVGFARPARAADDERVEQRGRLFGHFLGRRNGEVVFLVDQERVKGEFLTKGKVDAFDHLIGGNRPFGVAHPVIPIADQISGAEKQVELRFESVLYLTLEPFGEKGVGKPDDHALVVLFIINAERVEPLLEFLIGTGLEEMFSKRLFHDEIRGSDAAL